ncbi:MAG TPA: VWA domain-containing protein [Burkholderiales bacterium]|nr:VWA domain-containing protein [Burkholderiales bacterium]
MTLLWPEMLWLLAAVPAVVASYLWLLARRKKATQRYANLPMVEQAAGTGGKYRRYVPPVLFLLGFCALIFAVARPHAVIAVPTHQETIILAMDVSGSMRATDIEPNRLAAAQEAAKAFIAAQPRHVRIGVVSIAATASVVQSPTNNREDIVRAIDRFQLQRGTALGSGILISLATLMPEAGIDVEQFAYGRSSQSWMQDPARKGEQEKTVAPGSNTNAAIVLLSDGQANTGADPLEAAKLAAARGVRIFTVGVGTVEGATIGFEGWSMRVRLDEDTLKNIATMTRGDYFQAKNAADLKSIYKYLTAKLVLEKKRSTEVTALFVALGAGLATLGAILSMFWFNRIL